MIIHVTSIDIATNKHSCNNCPVFHALSRAFPGKIRGVGGSVMWYINDNYMMDQTKKLPIQVVTWIRNYDSGIRAVNPISFEFDLS